MLAIGIDASTDNLRDGVRRARKARLDNAIFVVASAQQLPHELNGTADLVTVHFPWGSLLEGIVGEDKHVVQGLAGLLAPAPRPAELRLLLSVTPKDGVVVFGGLAGRRSDRLDDDTAPDVIHAIAIAAAAGLTTIECRPATRTDIVEAHSTWGKRLLASGGERRAWLMRFGATRR